MRLLPLAILCALLGMAYWFGATALTTQIEQDIASRTNTVIEPYQDTVSLVVDGRDVTLTGKVSNEQTRAEALQTVDSVFGVRATRDSLSLMDPFDLYAKFQNGDNVSATGAVDATAMSAINKHFTPIPSNLQTDAAPLQNGPEKIALASEAIGKMQQAELWMDKDQLKITGEAADEQTKADIEQYLQQQKTLIDPLRLVTNISAPEPLATNYTENCASSYDTSDSTFVNEVVLFEVDSANVQSGYFGTIQNFAEQFRDCINTAQATVIIEAHADHDGSEEYNLNLSQRRADNIAAMLRSHGLDSARLETFAFGETRPVASNELVSEKSFNRRVEIRFIRDSANQTFISINSAE